MRELEKIKDECSLCGEIFTCKLCKQGHGIGQEHDNVPDMMRCQFRHRKIREGKNEEL